MTLYFILFLQLVTLLTGASILSPQKNSYKGFHYLVINHYYNWTPSL